MAVLGSDKFAIDRSGTLYSQDMASVLAYVRSNLGTSEYNVADITARNALAGMSVGDIAYVVDASADATVTSGWAVYMWQGAAWSKISEQESIDVVQGGTDLSYTPSAANGIVVSSTGTDATIPAATNTAAGLLTPAQFDKLQFISVTTGINLDTLQANSHAAVTTAGSANTNPIVVTGQQLSFSIANLTAAP
jgi:hypothetical protein